MSRLALAATIALGLLGAACSDDAGPRVGPYPVASTPTITPSRTLTDSRGLHYLVDDEKGCVQIDMGGGIATGCVDFAPATDAVNAMRVERSGDDVVTLVVVNLKGTTGVARGARIVGRWSTPTHDLRPDLVDAIELTSGVYALAYKSPVDDPIWGVQLRTADGGLVQATPVVGQFLNAPR